MQTFFPSKEYQDSARTLGKTPSPCRWCDVMHALGRRVSEEKSGWGEGVRRRLFLEISLWLVSITLLLRWLFWMPGRLRETDSRRETQFSL